MTSGYRWAFKARFRAHAYGWRGSSRACTRLKEAVGEINSVAKSDRVLAAEGCVSLMERLWSALEAIDTATASVAGASQCTCGYLIPSRKTATVTVQTPP